MITVSFEGVLTLYKYFPSKLKSVDMSMVSMNSGTTLEESQISKNSTFGTGTTNDETQTSFNKNVRYYQKVCSVNLGLQTNLYMENAFSLAVCPKSTFVAVGTINRSQNSKICRLIVHKLSKMHTFNYCSELNFTNTYFSEHPESYFYDIRIDQYLGQYPVIFGI